MADNVTTAGLPATAAPETAPAAEAAPVETPKTPALAETIRQMREERETRVKGETERADLRRQLEEARAELAKMKDGDDPLADPPGWAKRRGLQPKEQAALGEALLYDLVPDKAPPDFRAKMLEAKLARKEREEREAQARAKAEAETEAGRQALMSYETALHGAVKSFTPDSHPESEAWFGEDRATYARSLLATARNLAEAARAQGQVADLSPNHVADVLEKEIARRMTARDARRAGAKSVGDAPKGPDGNRQAIEEPSQGGVLSTKGLGSGGPRPAALDDKERVNRAVSVGWRTR